MRRIFLIFCALWLSGAHATTAAAGTLGMVTGPKTGTYITFGKEIADAVKNTGVKIEVKASDGSIDNIKRLNSTENAALGIAQSDVLGFMSRSQSAETMRLSENLRMLLPLYHEEVHVLARGNIQSFADLADKRVVIGEDGSGHMLTSINLFAMMNVTPKELIRKSPPEGLLALLDHTVDAVIFVGGKPVKLFQNLGELEARDNAKYQALLQEVHFVPMNAPRMLEEYQTAELTKKDYAFVTQTVPTIAVTAVLVSYDFSDGSKKNKSRCEDVRKLAEALKKNLKTLQKDGHPKWKEVKFEQALPIWRKDTCAWPESPAKAKASGNNLDKDLIDVIKRR